MVMESNSGLPARPAGGGRALQIRADVLAHGFARHRNTFVQAYGSPALDASLLLIPKVGFLPGDDPRVLGTIAAIQRNLTEDGFVLRYRTDFSDDGLPGGEGVFLACSFWLVDALVGAGRPQEATSLFERLLELRNDVGRSARNGTPRHGGTWLTLRGISHFPLVMSALTLQAGACTAAIIPQTRPTGEAARRDKVMSLCPRWVVVARRQAGCRS